MLTHFNRLYDGADGNFFTARNESLFSGNIITLFYFLGVYSCTLKELTVYFCLMGLSQISIAEDSCNNVYSFLGPFLLRNN